MNIPDRLTLLIDSTQTSLKVKNVVLGKYLPCDSNQG